MAMTNVRSFSDIYLTYGRRLTVVLGMYCLLGWSASLYVYYQFPHPSVVHFFGKTPRTESIEVYLFAFPAMVTFAFLGVAVQVVFWKTFLPRRIASEERQLAKNPHLRSIDRVSLVKWTSIGGAGAVMIFLAVSLYRSALVATNSL